MKTFQIVENRFFVVDNSMEKGGFPDYERHTKITLVKT